MGALQQETSHLQRNSKARSKDGIVPKNII